MMMMMNSTVGSISDLSNFINAKIFGHLILNPLVCIEEYILTGSLLPRAADVRS